jgi:hypothetical protein
MQSKAKTAAEYLKGLPPERRKEIAMVRKVILKNLPKGYKEGMQYGMLSYMVPLTLYPKGYGGKKDVPLPYVCLASQKNYYALYLMHTYGNKEADAWFRKAYKESGKKLDMGKGCVRFKKLEDLPLDVIGKTIALIPVKKFIAQYEAVRGKK